MRAGLGGAETRTADVVEPRHSGAGEARLVSGSSAARKASARRRIVFYVTSAVGVEVAVAGPFEACVRVGGEEIRGCLADLSLDVLRRCAPVRMPGVYRRQRHMPGRWFSTTARRFLEYESLLERDWMLLMDFDREVEWVCEQPLRLRYLKDGLAAIHVPDLLVWRGARPELCDVKSEERLEDPEFNAQVRATGLACAEAGLGYRVLSQPERQLLVNVRWLAGFREPPPDRDGERLRMLSAPGVAPSTICRLLADARERALARPVLMHMLWAGDALLDPGIPIGDDSVVWAPAGS